MKNTPPALWPVPLFSFVLLACALVGCGHKASIVGKWQGVIAQPTGNVNSTFEFTPDGKETITGQMSAGGVAMNVVVNGTYSVDGTNVTQTLTTATLGNQTRTIPSRPSKPLPFTLDGDHLTLPDPTGKQSLTLTRVKG